MTEPRHHIPDRLIADYASGNMSYPHAMVTASHISRCAECRARYESHLAIGGILIEEIKPIAMSGGARAAMLDRLDAAPAPEQTSHLPIEFPEPLGALIGPDGPKWRNLGFGSKQSILWEGDEGSVRLLQIAPGKAVPDHGHNGCEMTLVLKGSYTDEHATFAAGDIEIAEGEDVHQPIAGDFEPCVCLVSTDAPIKFSKVLPRIIQPLLRI